MFKKIWKWVKSPIKSIKNFVNERLIAAVFAHLQTAAVEKVNYAPIRNFIVVTIKRLKSISGLYLDDNPDNKSQLKAYIHENKMDMIRDVMELKRAILMEELNDQELAKILKRHSEELEEYLFKNGA